MGWEGWWAESATGRTGAPQIYDGGVRRRSKARDEEVLGETMAPFVAMVRQHLPLVDARGGRTARWSGY